uniref:F-box/LRR-repeat protein 4-like n=1 Tax=Saccoglossus kowalevskii TaxID=10224 RepID=A0ABM0MV29_SACKO
IIRLEFNQSHLEYYTELDAIELVGTLIKDHEGTDLDEAYAVHMMKNMQLNEQCDFDDIIHSEFPAGGNNGFFDVLPGEVIQLILTYLDILSLGNVALTCRLFYKHCYDPLQYVELDLQSYWTQVRHYYLDILSLGNVALTCRLFYKHCYDPLQYVELDLQPYWTQFLNEACIKSIADYCPLLQELNLQSCTYLSNDALRHIRRLTHLHTLNLYRSSIGDPTLINILSNLPDLEHLNLGSCVNLTSLDNVVTELCGNWKKLRSLDLWRAKTISHIGLRALANNCPRLAELDLGWCSEINSNTQCFIHLVQNCTELRKLFLTAN